MATLDSVDLRFTGDYDFNTSVALAARASFVEPLRQVGDSGGSRQVLDLAFPAEGSWHPVGVRVAEHADGVRAELVANPGGVPSADISDQLRRIFSLEPDGHGFAALATSDPVVAGLQRRFPGLRPISYPSPYECAARVIIQHRLSFRQAATIADRIATANGTAVDFGDRVRHAFPPPERLAALTAVPGLAGRKVDQLRALGERSHDERFTSDYLRSMPQEQALKFLQEFPGIGPFSAELILIRGAGHPDVFPRTETSLHSAMTQAYQTPDDPADLTALETVAEAWSPYRSWVGLLLRHTVEH